MTMFKNELENCGQGPIALGTDLEGATPSALRTPDALCATRSEAILADRAKAELQAWRAGAAAEVMAAHAQTASEISQLAQPVARVIYGVSF